MEFILSAIIFGLFVDYFWLKQKSNKWPKVRNPFYVD